MTREVCPIRQSGLDSTNVYRSGWCQETGGLFRTLLGPALLPKGKGNKARRVCDLQVRP